jgi:hypothetical protein
MIAMLLLGVLLSVASAVALWTQLDKGEFSFGKMIFLVWLPRVAGSLLVTVSIVLLIAKMIKGM